MGLKPWAAEWKAHMNPLIPLWRHPTEKVSQIFCKCVTRNSLMLYLGGKYK